MISRPVGTEVIISILLLVSPYSVDGLTLYNLMFSIIMLQVYVGFQCGLRRRSSADGDSPQEVQECVLEDQLDYRFRRPDFAIPQSYTALDSSYLSHVSMIIVVTIIKSIVNLPRIILSKINQIN